MESRVEAWTRETLAKALEGFELSPADLQEIIKTALALDSSQEVVEYFSGFLGYDGAIDFASQLEAKKKEKTGAALQGIWKTQAMNVQQLLQHQLGLDDASAETLLAQALAMDDDARHEFLMGVLGPGFESERIVILLRKQKEAEQKAKDASQAAEKALKKKKKKNKQPDTPREKVGNAPSKFDGRPICQCMATVHTLLCNCLHCGKIICDFEGDSTCPFCGLVPGDVPEMAGLSSALARSLTLVDYQENSAQRTHVHDQAADYDAGADQFNKWISPEERALSLRRLQEKERLEQEQKARRVITLDIENKLVREEKPRPVSLDHLDRLDPVPAATVASHSTGLFRNPTLRTRAPPVFVLPPTDAKEKKPAAKRALSWDAARLQDEHLALVLE
ncbi:hypothetical protein HDU91_000652 [Kappamyces sp. JEL0680]|nr:hypothetical protein HDU91_000652 [Kappamyces sp. JEL0680]